MINITVKDYFELEDVTEYLVLQCIEPSNELQWFKGASLRSLNYGDIMLLKRFKGDYKDVVSMFRLVFGMKEINLLNLHVVDFYKGLNYFYKELNNLMESESKMFNFPETESSLTWQAAQETTGHNLSLYGELNTMKGIVREYGYSFKEVEELSYTLVISLLVSGIKENVVKDMYSKLSTLKTRI